MSFSKEILHSQSWNLVCKFFIVNFDELWSLIINSKKSWFPMKKEKIIWESKQRNICANSSKKIYHWHPLFFVCIFFILLSDEFPLIVYPIQNKQFVSKLGSMNLELKEQRYFLNFSKKTHRWHTSIFVWIYSFLLINNLHSFVYQIQKRWQ